MTKILIRFFDLLFTLILIIISLPLFIIISPMILLEDFGPIFFCQKRIGKNGRIIKVIKFRTMHRGAEKLEKLMFDKGGRMNLQMQNDPRITKIGRLLRSHSFDELPQVFNVIAGNMSLVGPRPLVPLEVKLFSRAEKERFKVLPGITGLAQLFAREKSNKEVVKYDIHWVKNYSLRLYFSILFKTLPIIFIADGI